MSDDSKDLGPQEKITKLQAARRQLHTAIRLFLSGEDIVSAHTLASASHEILRNLLKAKGGASALKDSPYVKAEYKNEFNKHRNRPSNFLKHAGRDPNDVLTFYQMFCAIWLIDCCMMYRALTGKLSRTCAAFTMWFAVERPNCFIDEVATQIQSVLEAGVISRNVITKDFCMEIIRNPSIYPMPPIGIYEEDSAT